MKAIKNILVVVLCIFMHSVAFSQVKFERILGGTGYDYGYSVVQTYDKGYVLAGATSSFGYGSNDMYLHKTDSMGVSLWQKTFGGINIEQGFSITQTTDTGLVIAGYTNSFGLGGYDMYVIKTDKSGNVLWTKTYGGTNWDFAYSIQQTADGGFIVAGGTYSFGAGDEDMFLVKTDSNGDTLWTKSYGGLYEDEASSVVQTSDGGYILTGHTKSFGDTNGDIYTVKTDNNGDTLWTKKLSFPGVDKATQIIQTIDGGYISTGLSEDILVGRNDAFIVKTDMSGDTVFTKRFGSPNDAAAYSICESSFGGYVWVGKLKIGSNYKVYFYKIDIFGNWNYAYLFGGVDDSEGQSVKQTTDKGYIVVGNTNSYNNGLGDVYLFKTDSLGISSGVVVNLATSILAHSYSEENLFVAYPNPVTNGSCKIIVQPKLTGKLSIYSLTGQLVSSKQFEKQNYPQEVEFNTSLMNNGMYFIEMITDEARYTTKLSVENH